MVPPAGSPPPRPWSSRGSCRAWRGRPCASGTLALRPPQGPGALLHQRRPREEARGAVQGDQAAADTGGPVGLAHTTGTGPQQAPGTVTQQLPLSPWLLVRADRRLDGLILNDQSDPPQLQAVELEEVPEADAPEATAGFVLYRAKPFFLRRAIPSALSSDPGWYGLLVEKQVFADWTATAQSFHPGRLWQIVHAEPEGSLSFLDRLMPWSQIRLRMSWRCSP